jgi:hypothetical protein
MSSRSSLPTLSLCANKGPTGCLPRDADTLGDQQMRFELLQRALGDTQELLIGAAVFAAEPFRNVG